jgi:RNA polymerase sigma-70 factor (ECF subfamily)
VKEKGVKSTEAVMDTKAVALEDAEHTFQNFLREGVPGLLILARHLLRDEEEARDLVQDALLRAYLALETFRWECSLKSWVRRIVVNQGLKRLRRRRLRERVTSWLRTGKEVAPASGSFGPAPLANPEEATRLNEQVRILEEAMQTLSPRQRTALVLRYQEDMSVEEIADAMDIGVGTVKTHLVRAVRQVRSKKDRASVEVEHGNL